MDGSEGDKQCCMDWRGHRPIPFQVTTSSKVELLVPCMPEKVIMPLS